MAPALLSYFGIGSRNNTTQQDEDEGPVRGLPASWYTSQEMYELERRAIFSKKWLLITHKSRLSKTGDFLRYDVASFQFVLARDRQGNVNAFHNICRHRAYPVVEKEQGCVQIFSCRYHGWSYGLNGKLAKAPGYQELDGFDKSQNGLFQIHSHIDRNGFVWVNLDGKQEPETAWEDDLEGVDEQEDLDEFDFDEYTFDHEWQVDGAFNWKIVADNYNDDALTPERKEAGTTVSSNYFFPNASLNVSPHAFLIQKCVPLGPKSSIIKYEVFRNKNSTDQQFQHINQIYKRMTTENKSLCDFAQQNLNGGVFINGEMHPEKEQGPLFFQKSVRDAVKTHRKLEQASKKEIWPARQQLPNSASVSKEDIDFCTGLACSPSNQAALAW